MKAVLRVRPGQVALVDRPTPQPGPGEILIRVRACGLCGSDLARLRDPDDKWNRVVLGHECIGSVEALGPSDSPSPMRERGLGGEASHTPPIPPSNLPPLPHLCPARALPLLPPPPPPSR